jgi:dTDP-glucose pyrophosphorylase/CBS domain-containing protein
MINVQTLFVTLDESLKNVLRCIDTNRQGIALVVDEQARLIDTITDGDLRRAILDQLSLDACVNELLPRKHSKHPPVTASPDTPEVELLRLMNRAGIRHVPLVDSNSRVVSIALLTDLATRKELNLRGVVMAGGLGTRLRPLTNSIPKPMVPIAGRPLLEHIVDQLRESGIRRVDFTTFYKGEVIEEHFGDGTGFGVQIGYTQETEPLGTAGSLRLLNDWNEPLLVINGDIFTRMDFRALLHFHEEHHADMTVAVRAYEISVPYGVVETDGELITGISEKPVIRNFINAGVYLLNPKVRQLIPASKVFHMTDLIHKLTSQKRRVICFPIHEYWIDIGKTEDYQEVKLELARRTV